MAGLRLFGLRPSVVLLMLGAGGLVGSLAYWSSIDRSQASLPGPGSTGASGQEATAESSARYREQTDPAQARGAGRQPTLNPPETGHVFATAGLRLEPLRDEGQFIGYRVIENASDSRFAVGDVIVSVNGSPVEGTAAGSELLIASLRNAGADVGLLAESADN